MLSKGFLRSCMVIFIAFAATCASFLGGAEEAARDKLLNLFYGEWISRSLYVATKLEIADHLQSGPLSVESLAHLTSSNPSSLGRLLHLLAGLDVFEEVSPGIFANTETSCLLMKTHPDKLNALAIFYGEDIHKSWDALFASIQTGTPAFELVYNKPVFTYFKENPERALLFQEVMKEKSRAAIKSSLSAYDFSPFKTICDVGGGYGQFLQALLQKYPHLSGSIFELPEVIVKIKEQNPKFENEHCSLIAGDFFVSVPEGRDAYLLKSVIHDWDDAKAEIILKNCHQAMKHDSKLLLVEMVLEPKGHSHANCVDILMLAITGGKERSLQSFKELLDRAGFVLESLHPTSTEFSILEARKK